MLAKKIKYEDFNGVMQEREFHFNMSKAEIIRWLTTDGDYTLDKKLERLYEERNGNEIMKIFEDLLTMSCGKKSLDGQRFDKSPEAKADFLESEAYSVLFTELVSDAKKASEFFNAIVPKQVAEEIAKAFKENPEGIPAEIRDYMPRA